MVEQRGKPSRTAGYPQFYDVKDHPAIEQVTPAARWECGSAASTTRRTGVLEEQTISTQAPRWARRRSRHSGRTRKWRFVNIYEDTRDVHARPGREYRQVRLLRAMNCGVSPAAACRNMRRISSAADLQPLHVSGCLWPVRARRSTSGRKTGIVDRPEPVPWVQEVRVSSARSKSRCTGARPGCRRSVLPVIRASRERP